MTDYGKVVVIVTMTITLTLLLVSMWKGAGEKS